MTTIHAPLTDLDKKLLSYKDEMIAELSALCSIPSVEAPAEPSAPFGAENRRALDYMLALAAKNGFEARDFDGYAMDVTLPAEAPEKMLGILAHLDVVPAGDGWTSQPFAPVIRDGMIYARGVTDDKNACIACLYAMKAIRECNVPLKDDVRLIMGCNEESGSEDMHYYKTKVKIPDYGFSPDGSFPVVYAEKGIQRVRLSAPIPAGTPLNRVEAGTVVNVVPNHAYAHIATSDPIKLLPQIDRLAAMHKISVTTKVSDTEVVLDVQGVSAHASLPHLGKNAACCMLTLLAGLDMGEANETVRALSNMLPIDGYDGHGVNAALSDDCSGALTLNLGLIELANGKLTATLDIRQPVKTTMEQVFEPIREVAKEHGILAESLSYSKPLYIPKDDPMVKTLQSVYAHFTGDTREPIAIGGGTYARQINHSVAFGAEDIPGTRSGGMHEANEHLDLDEFMLTARIYTHAIVALAGRQ